MAAIKQDSFSRRNQLDGKTNLVVKPFDSNVNTTGTIIIIIIKYTSSVHRQLCFIVALRVSHVTNARNLLTYTYL